MEPLVPFLNYLLSSLRDWIYPVKIVKTNTVLILDPRYIQRFPQHLTLRGHFNPYRVHILDPFSDLMVDYDFNHEAAKEVFSDNCGIALATAITLINT